MLNSKFNIYNSKLIASLTTKSQTQSQRLRNGKVCDRHPQNRQVFVLELVMMSD